MSISAVSEADTKTVSYNNESDISKHFEVTNVKHKENDFSNKSIDVNEEE